MDRKHFLKGSEAREQALLQRNLETQTRPEVTPFLNTQTAASSRTSCLCVAQLNKKQKPDGVYRANFASLFGDICMFAPNQPKGEVSQDMRYPICLIRHLFLNRPHLHSLPRFIHKKKKLPTVNDDLPCKNTRMFLLHSSRTDSCLFGGLTRGSCCCVLRNVANIEPYNV